MFLYELVEVGLIYDQFKVIGPFLLGVDRTGKPVMAEQVLETEADAFAENA